ncbi:XPNPEP3 [Cordylochernes scorpioides]|uniref:XPNPEP3 n=1 Tax=Cordylochernes scorpioides TaxID=51811 RepID=A0ABY6K268_9ARAC|nr:XPNPEP3 [Cordylochernes scorpioides]
MPFMRKKWKRWGGGSNVLELLGRFSMWFIIKFKIATLEFFKPPVTLQFAQRVVAVNFLEHSVGFSGTFLPVEGEQQNFPQMGTFWLGNRHFPRALEIFHDLNFSETARMLMPRESKNKTPTTAPPSAQIKLHSALWQPFSRFILIDLVKGKPKNAILQRYGFNMMTHSFLRALRRFKSTTIPSPLPKAKGKQGVRGQPTPKSHPHLLQAGQVAPGITRQEFQARRYRLMEAIQTHCHRTCLKASNHVAIIPSATKVHMSDKIPYPFRQNSEFLYLTGFQEPDSILLLTSSGEKELPEHQSTLFVPRRQAQTELWEGQKTGPEDAVELLGVDGAYPLEDLDKFLESMLTSRDGPHVVWYDFLHPILPSCHKSLEHLMSDAPNSVHFEMDSLRRLLHQVRVVKSEAEISLMRKSAAIAGEAISRTIQAGYQQESQMWARMEYECRLQGAERLAYPPVVGGGSRANTIHYTHNNCLVEPPDMVLMDAGCEYHGYVSDITRTWPVSGQFTPPQRALYEAVLETQQELIELCAERLSLNQLYSAMTQLLGSRLQSLGIVPARVGKIEMNQLTNNFCPHHVGHYLGMDVHDCPEVSRSDPLTPGMVITIEPGTSFEHSPSWKECRSSSKVRCLTRTDVPGLYLREDNPWVPPEFRGLGVRIEDDVLITSGRPEVLSSKCPKDPDEICALVPRT